MIFYTQSETGIMLVNKKTLVLFGLAAAYLYYRYNKMSATEKEELKDKGRKLMEEYLPEDLKNILGVETGKAAKEKAF